MSKPTELESRLMAARGPAGGDGSDCLNGYRVSFGVMKTFQDRLNVMVANIVPELNATELYTLRRHIFATCI